MSKIFAVLAAVVGLMFATSAFAHSALKSSTPADGATVTDVKTLLLTFSAELRLVTVKITGNGVDESLPVDRDAAPATSYSLALPKLPAGTVDVKWTAAAPDGHVMTGSLSFTVSHEGHEPGAN